MKILTRAWPPLWVIILLIWWIPIQAQPTVITTVEIDTIFEDSRSKTIDVVLYITNDGKPFTKLYASDLTLSENENRTSSSKYNANESRPLKVSTIRSYEPLGGAKAGYHRIKTRSEDPLYVGNERTITVGFSKGDRNQTAEKSFTIGSIPEPINHKPWFSFMNIFVTGLFIAALLLFIFSEVINFVKRMIFKNKHVTLYKNLRKPGVRHSDPVTMDNFTDDDLVVNVCRTLHGWETWKGNGYNCIEAPSCMHNAKNPCPKNVSFGGGQKFFTQSGIFKHLNWLWLGCLGGVLAWVLRYGITFLTKSLPGLESITDGFALGLALVFFLAWAEERGAGTRFSWMRILLRTLTGAFVGALIFWLGAFLVDALGGGALPEGIRWVLLGIGIGGVLSIKSSISWIRGLIGGAIGGVVAFGAYYLLLITSGDTEMAKMIGFVLFGSLFGLILVTYITRLEKIELEFIAPEKARLLPKVPISKWLLGGQPVSIGAAGNSNVFIKWNDDGVEAQHAQIFFRNNHSFIRPIAATKIGNRYLAQGEEAQLRDGDVIQLGRNNVTRLLYHEKKSK